MRRRQEGYWPVEVLYLRIEEKLLRFVRLGGRADNCPFWGYKYNLRQKGWFLSLSFIFKRRGKKLLGLYFQLSFWLRLYCTGAFAMGEE